MDRKKGIEDRKQKVLDSVAKNDDIICGLCDEIIELSKLENDMQSIAFAYVWKADHYFYVHFNLEQLLIELKNAEKYIDTKNATTLLEKFYALFVVFYENTYDVKSCFQYCFKALEVAEAADLKDRIGVAYGNIGNIYFDQGCNQEALEYTKKALDVISTLPEKRPGVIRILLNNIIVLYLEEEQLDNAKEKIDELAELPLAKNDLKIYVDYVKLLYCAANKNKEKAIFYLQELIDDQIMTFSNRSYVVEFLTHVLRALLYIDAKEAAEEVLMLFAKFINENETVPKLTLCKLKILFAQKYKLEDRLIQYYREYFDLYEYPMLHFDELRIQGLKIKLELSRINSDFERVQGQVDSLEKLVNFDELTQLYNRRYFNVKRNQMVNNKNTYSISYVIFDVDYFKEYNDRYGHVAGDNVLKEVAKSIKDQLFENMVAASYGGDEFVVLAWNINDDILRTYIEAVRTNLEKKHIVHLDSKCAKRITLSIGFGSAMVHDNMNVNELFDIVDEALYSAKESGRNSVKSIQDIYERIKSRYEKI